jgi:hypothetical protein
MEQQVYQLQQQSKQTAFTRNIHHSTTENISITSFFPERSEKRAYINSVETADIGHRKDNWVVSNYLDPCALAVFASRCETTWSTDSADTPYSLMIASCEKQQSEQNTTRTVKAKWFFES